MGDYTFDKHTLNHELCRIRDSSTLTAEKIAQFRKRADEEKIDHVLSYHFRALLVLY